MSLPDIQFSKGLTALLTLLCIFPLLVACFGSAQVGQTPVELTQVDLFSLPDWQHRPVAVDGFFIGMARKEAMQSATQHGVELIRPKVRPTCCPVSDVYQAVGKYHGHGNFTGIRLYFDEADRISKIGIEISEGMDPDVKEANITRKFKGLTSQLFTHYSDGLRQQIFGIANPKESPRTHVADDNDVVLEYDYPLAGVAVMTSMDTRERPALPWEITVNFAAPR